MNSKQLENYGISPPLKIHQFLIPLNFQSPWGKSKSYSVFFHTVKLEISYLTILFIIQDQITQSNLT